MNVTNIIAIAVAAVIAVVSASLIANVFWIDSEMEPAPSWQYDDYKVLPDVVSASGSLELSTMYGTEYVHAKDVGAGTIEYVDGTTENITVKKALIDLYYTNGQSNATYMPSVEQTNPATADPYPELGTSYFISPLINWSSLVPLYNDDGSHAIGNTGPSFMANYYEETGHKVLYVQGGLAGRSILVFQPNEGMYNRTVTIMGDIFGTGILSDTDHYQLGKSVMIWIQGEADNDNMTSDQYYDYFVTFWESYQTTAHPFDYCLISKLTHEFDNIRAADQRLIDSRSDMYLGADIVKDFTIENGLMASDNLHYSQEGRNILGDKLAESAKEVYTHQKADYFNPQLERIVKIFPVLFFIAIIVAAIRLSTRENC